MTAGSVGGCGVLDRDEPPPPPDPLAPLIAGALDLEARHRAAITADPALAERLAPLADAHRAHATELARTIGTALPSRPPGTPPDTSNGDPAGVIDALRAAEERGRDAAATLCAQAAADRVALVGSIVAARATHVEVLQ